MTKRVCELVKGDVFVYANGEFKVVLIKDNRIYYKPYSYCASNLRSSFGIKCKMKAEIVPMAQSKIIPNPHLLI